MSTSTNENAAQEMVARHLSGDEIVVTMAETAMVPLGYAHFVPLVGGLVQLGRASAAKPHLVVITNKRFLLIQFNRWSTVRGLEELGCKDYPIGAVVTAVADRKIVDREFGDSLKITTNDGQKFALRGLTYATAQNVCASINEVKKRGSGFYLPTDKQSILQHKNGDVMFSYSADLSITSSGNDEQETILLESADSTLVVFRILHSEMAADEANQSILGSLTSGFQGKKNCIFKPIVTCTRNIGTVDFGGHKLSLQLMGCDCSYEAYSFKHNGHTITVVFYCMNSDREKAEKKFGIICDSLRVV